MEFDALWVAGLQADRMPAPTSPDALIPLELQREAGVPEATAAGVLLEQATLRNSSAGSAAAARSVLSWPEREGDAELDDESVARAFPMCTGAAAHSPQALLRHVLFEHRPELDAVTDDRAPPLAAQSARGGAAILELQSRCPFKAQAQLRLQRRAAASSLRRVSMRPNAVGSFTPCSRKSGAHCARNRLCSQHRSMIWNGECANAAQRLAAAQLRPDYAHARTSGEPRSREHRSTDHAAVGDREAAAAIQSAFRRSCRAILDRRPEVTLRPDRIDELAEGGELLIDYKLG